MSFFSGTAGPKRKVDLRGKSRQEETREQVLARTRLEREERQRAKLEQKSALLIQAYWRQHSTACKYAEQLRNEWINAYEIHAADRANFDTLATDGVCISKLLRFYNPANQGDRGRLAAVCRALSRAAAAGACPLLQDAAAAVVTMKSPPSDSPSRQQLSLFRLRKLALMCLKTLSTCVSDPHFQADLYGPFASLASSQQTSTPAALLGFLLRFINPDTWKASCSAIRGADSSDQQQQQVNAEAAAGAGALLKHLYKHKLYSHLSVLLAAVPAAGLQGKTAAEVLVTQMTVRSITLQLVPTRTPPTSAATAEHASATDLTAPADYVSYGVTQLLFVPGLWAKCSSLGPVAGRLCQLALAEVAQQGGNKQLLSVLMPAGGSSSSTEYPARGRTTGTATAETDALCSAAEVSAAASAISAFVDNIVEASASGVLLKPGDVAEQVLAGQLLTVLLLLLEAARQLAVIQRRLRRQQRQQQQAWKAAAIRHQQQGQQDKSRGPGFVAGAGFVPAVGGGADASMSLEEQNSSEDAADDMDIDAQTAVGTAGRSHAAAGDALGQQDPAAQQQHHHQQQQQEAAVIAEPVAASAWSGEQKAAAHQAAAPGSSISNGCLQLIAGSSKGLLLLRKLVMALLPTTTAADASQQQQQQQQQEADITAQQQLCALLWRLTRSSQYRQKVWLGLSVGASLVPRLWFSYILPAHLRTRGGFLAYAGGGDGSSNGSATAAGWLLPMLVQCQSFSAALSFTHSEDFYAGSPALVPLQQLYDAAAPGAGLLMLLKGALWQVLWCDNLGAPGSSSLNISGSSQQRQQQQQQLLLKKAFREVGGLLLCQLHDRNCTRQFCPPAAFLTDSLAPGRLQQEVQAAAARGGVGALGPDSEDEEGSGDPSASLQQQQHWQQQRGAGVAAAGAADQDSDEEEGDEGLGAGEEGEPWTGPAASRTGHPRAAGYSEGDGTAAQVQRRRTASVSGFAPPAAFAAGAGSSSSSSAGGRVWQVLQHAPCLIPFQERVQLFQSVVAAEKESAAVAAAGGNGNPFVFDDSLDLGLMQPMENRFVTIRRDQLLDDGYRQLARMDPDRIKGRLRISYVNEAGAAEAGIDGGGLFKDFMEELLKQGFGPQSLLFSENPQHQLYPSPAAYQLVPDADGQLQFLGRMLGKSLYEGMLLELPLAAFFLKKMRGGVCDVNDMLSLDPEVYKHLLQLRHYKGDLSELALTFTATVVDTPPPGAAAAAGSSSSSSSSAFAPRQREVELKPGGRDIPVRADNVIEYIHRLADFRLNRQMDRAAAAFLRGFFEMVRPRWVRMFNEAELQMLISGSEEGIDVDNLMDHINYAGGYHEEHPVIITLWEAVRSFSPQQQRQFLKFVTSCSRAPLLGFAHLEPRLCVQMSGGVLDPGARQRLPTAATCMNLLKLPPYKGVAEMREKLLYAITAGAGFELS